MPSTYSPSLRTELIANGEQSGTWGNTTNVNLGTILDNAIAGYTNVTVSSTAAFALTANNGSADQSRNMIIQLSGSPGGAFNVFIPPASKFYVIRNATDSSATLGNATALNGTTASGGTTVTIKSGVTSLVFSDGTNVREALSGFAGSLDVNGNLIVNGSTTLGTARLAGTYSQSLTTVTVTTATAHGYTTGDAIGFIAYTGSGSPEVFASSGTYTITVTGTTSFTFTASPSQTCSGNCLVTNDTITLNGIVQSGVVIEGSSSTIPALRVTHQSGTAASFVVDDQSNPDATAFIIDASGNVVTGHTAALTTFNNSATTPRIQEVGIIANDAAMGLALFSATDADSPTIDLSKSGAAAIGTYTAVANNEALGLIRFSGSDGTNLQPAASISGFADAEFTTSGDTSDSPGRLVFSTVPDGSNTLTERMRINNAGNVIIGIGEGTASATGGVLRAPDEVGTDLTGANLTVAAGNGTGTGGSGSILLQTAPVSTTGTTANTLATAVAIANTGNVAIGTTPATSNSLLISKNITRPTSGVAYGLYQTGSVQPVVTSASYFVTSANIAATTALTTLAHYEASQGTYTGTATTQYAFLADGDLIGATNNYGFAQTGVTSAGITAGKTLYNFYSDQDAAPSGGGVAYGFFADGTAVNSFSNLSSSDLSASALLARGDTNARGEINAYAPVNVTSTAYLNALTPQTVAQSTAVNVNDTITFASPLFVDGTAVMLESSGTLPTPLAVNTLYYVISTVGTSYYAGTGSITGSTLTMSSMQSGSLAAGSTVTGVGVPTGVTVVSGTGPTYTITPSLATPVASTTISGTYSGTQTIKLSTTPGGSAVNITAVGTGNLTLTPVSLANTPPVGSTTNAIATTAFVNSALPASLQTKQAVVAATTQNITLSGAQTIDGISIVAGDRVLVKDQFASSQTATITLGSTGTVTFVNGSATITVATGTTPASGTPLTFTTSGTLPTGLSVGQLYYASNLSGSTFSVSTSQTLSPLITVTSAGSGTHTATYQGVISVTSSVTAGTKVEFTTTGALPTDLTAGQPYYTLRTGTTFSVAFVPNGTPITFSGSQSGTQTLGVVPANTNGVYLANASTWTRATDMDTAAEAAAASVPVLSGTANGGKTFNTSFKSTDTLGTTTMDWDEVITGSAGDNSGSLGGIRVTVSGTTLNIFTY